MSLTNALGNAVGAIGKMNGSMLKMHPALMGLSLATKALTAAYNRADKYAQDNIKINERLLLLGTDRLQFSRENLAAIIDNTGSINDNIAVAAEMRALGIEQYRDQATSLAASMKMTGQNTQAALKLFTAMEFNTLMTVDQQERMSASIEQTAESFGRTAESIVKALNEINTSYLTRTGQDVEAVFDTVKDITGRFGETAGKQAAELINAFKVTSTEDLAKLARLGISEEIMAAQSGGLDPDQFADMVAKATGRLNLIESGQSATTVGIAFERMGFGAMPEMFKNMNQTLLGPERKFDPNRPSISDTLAAERARANKQSEVNMATVTGFRRLTEIGIEANALLDQVSTYLSLGLADLFGATDNNLAASLAIKEEMEAVATLAQEEADIAQQARLKETAEKASARQADAAALARLTGFEFSTVMQEVVESLHRDNAMLKEEMERLVSITNNQYQHTVLNTP